MPWCEVAQAAGPRRRVQDIRLGNLQVRTEPPSNTRTVPALVDLEKKA